MEINLLSVNVGNSRLGLGVFAAGQLQYAARLPLARGADGPDSADWSGKIADAWGRIAETDQPAVAAAGVNSALRPAIERAVAERTGQTVQWVGRELDLPIKVNTRAPGQTGVDRVLNIAAAYEQMQKACVVVDAGSAVTVDVCNDKGEFLGGSISPGIRMMLDALHERTARLPKVEFEAPATPFGKNTQDAMRHGVYHGIRGLVKELTENYATELGFWPDIIATGGDAEKLFEGWELIHAIAPDLTLYGIAAAYAEHHIKHGT